MVENRPWLTVLSHVVLSIGVLVTALPIWIAFVASTHPADSMLSGRTPLLPGGYMLENYATVLGSGVKAAGSIPVGTMLWNSFVMALMIAVGKIAISIIAAYAIVYFRFDGSPYEIEVPFIMALPTVDPHTGLPLAGLPLDPPVDPDAEPAGSGEEEPPA